MRSSRQAGLERREIFRELRGCRWLGDSFRLRWGVGLLHEDGYVFIVEALDEEEEQIQGFED